MIYSRLGYNVKPLRSSKKRTRTNGARKILISSAIRLSVSIRYYAGGSTYDIALVHGISQTEVYNLVWCVVDAVNQSPLLKNQFPEEHRVAEVFCKKSAARFSCCVGAIDGILVWTERPSMYERM
jgi:hypothetical protein